VAASTQGGADLTGGAGGAAGVAHIAEADRAAMRAANEAFARALQANDVDAALAADDAFHGVFVTASTNGEIRRALDRLMPRIRRLERLRFGSLQGRASVKQHAEILMAEPHRVPDLVKQNWLSLGALIDRSFE
jgi:DNA-binding GntR family transcriptional regulator